MSPPNESRASASCALLLCASARVFRRWHGRMPIKRAREAMAPDPALYSAFTTSSDSNLITPRTNRRDSQHGPRPYHPRRRGNVGDLVLRDHNEAASSSLASIGPAGPWPTHEAHFLWYIHRRPYKMASTNVSPTDNVSRWWPESMRGFARRNIALLWHRCRKISASLLCHEGIGALLSKMTDYRPDAGVRNAKIGRQ